MPLVECEKLALEILKQVMEEKINSINIEVCSVTADRGYHIYTTDEVAAILARVQW